MHVVIKVIVMESDRNLLGIIGNLLEGLWAFLWKGKLLKCLTISHLFITLCRLWNNKLYAHADKCSFHKDTVEYLGYILAPSGLTMDNNKVKVIQDWPELRKVKDVQSFLGFANFYRWFIHNYSDLTLLLTRLTQKGTPWSFSDSCRTLLRPWRKPSLLPQS